MKIFGLGTVAMSLLAATTVQAAPAPEGLAPRQYCPPGFSFPFWADNNYCNVPRWGGNGCRRECGVQPQCINGLCCVDNRDGGTC
jgi:hypothetical protein